jgi:hypothetical protein
MTESDAAFDRALGAWEDGQLNAHLAGEEAWEKAYDDANEAVWGLKLTELYEMAPPTIVREMESVAEALTAHVAELILEGRWDG